MQSRSKRFKGFLIIITLGLLIGQTTIAHAANKTITCYKGAVVKKVSAANPKCATGWSTTKPTVKAPVASATPAKSAAGVLAFSGTYKGKISMLWSESDVQATSVSATGSGNIFALDQLSGTGSSSPASACDGINGSGVFSGGGNTLKVTVDSTAKGCAEDAAAPTTVALTGNAIITGGTGKFAGATGTLKVTGSFAVKSTVAGTNETSALTLTLIGNINTK